MLWREGVSIQLRPFKGVEGLHGLVSMKFMARKKFAKIARRKTVKISKEGGARKQGESKS
jgi:hypothetical protein